MRIKEIYIEKSRTIKTEGALKRDHFRKITIGATAVTIKKNSAEELSDWIDEQMNLEINKLNRDKISFQDKLNKLKL